MDFRIKNHKVFLIIFLLFLITKIFSLFIVHDIWWDSSVYLGMGKYIYSLGEVGLWESSRPLILSLILGFFWKVGLNYILFGKLLVIAFSLGTLILTYLIAHEVFNKKIAIFSAIFLSLSSTFFLFNNILHSEIPSTFFTLLGFYFFIKKSYNFSGMFLGIAFMTRFFQIFAFIPLILLLSYSIIKGGKQVNKLFYFFLFFLIPVIPYLILNFLLYNNVFYPFILQSFMTKYTGWIFFQPFYFYFASLIKENILVPFSILGILIIFKKPSLRRISVVVMFLFIFIPYNLAAHKEMRLLIPALPFLYILTSYGVYHFINNFKKNRNLLLIIMLLILLILNIPKLKIDGYEDNLDIFYDYVGNEKIIEGLWISNPSFIANSDYKADELIYFPLYNSEKINELILNIDKAKHVLINTCDLLPCPAYDPSCNEKNDEFMELLNDHFSLNSFSEKGQCKYYIFN